jgi:ethanolamine utilization protein EutA
VSLLRDSAVEPASGDAVWSAENVQLTTVGVDIGSSTSHLLFSLVGLQRRGRGLSSRFAVISRSSLYRSPIILTPYLGDGRIDAASLATFADEACAAAVGGASRVDSGAVILTGQAARSHNARPIAAALAKRCGVFVCAAAGHHLEAKLAAHGSGAAALSRRTGMTLAHLDIGGGTAKFALVSGGQVCATAAVAVGGRVMSFDRGGGLARLSDSGAQVARLAGLDPVPGARVSVADRRRIAAEMAGVIAAMLSGGDIGAARRPLLLTEPLPATPRPDAVTFSGGVAEYLYGRETADHGDLGHRCGTVLGRAVGQHDLRSRSSQPAAA